MTDSFSAKVGREFKAGQVLFREGDKGEEMFVIHAGKVLLTKRGPGGDVALATLGRGEFLGEMAILNGKPRTATATVIEDGRCLVLDGRTLEMLISTSPEIAIRLVKKLAERLAAADELVQILLHPDPKARVMLGLRRHAEAFGDPSKDGGVTMSITGDGLASELGVSSKDVNEVLARLRRLHLVTGAKGEVLTVPDMGKLLEFLEFLEIPRSGT